MKYCKQILSFVFTVTVAFSVVSISPFWSTNALAQTKEIISAKTIVDQAKTDKLVGEKLNGYLGFVAQDVSDDIRAAANEINIKRKSIYTALAREQNVGVGEVAGLAGEKLIAKAKPGEMVMLGDNQWHVAGS